MKLKMLTFILLSLSLQAVEPISPVPQKVEYDHQKAAIGKMLFYDPILSKDNSTACITCHDLYSGGADSKTVSIGFAGREGNIQSPTVLNARYNFRQFWNGRAFNLLEQVQGPLNNPAEHNMDPKTIVLRLNNSKLYKKQFKKVYNTAAITYKEVLEVIVEFEKALVTPNSKFDRYLRGEVDLQKNEKEGYILFKQYGCITCHNGINIGGNSFQKMGTFIEYNSSKNYPDRSKVVHNREYKNVFKVPTLRNITLTAPYFHDGSAKTLNEAVKKMSYHNLGILIPQKDIDKIISFLHTLKGDKPAILDEN